MNKEMNNMKGHRPVMTDELIAMLGPKDDGVYVDGSFGGGGHARAVLRAARCRVLAIDCDEEAVKRGAGMRAEFSRNFSRNFSGRLSLDWGRFGNLREVVSRYNVDGVDGVYFDAGVSSFQLEDGARGFSYQKEGELDMRLDRRRGLRALDYINRLSQYELRRVISFYGEERLSRRLARAIVRGRARAPITRTSELADMVLSVRPRRLWGKRRDRVHPATRVFLAFRVLVNDELGELARGLSEAEWLLRPGGRLVVISFHSLEDRIVKRFFQQRAGGGGAGVSRYEPMREALPPSFELLTRSPMVPTEGEVEANPRCRSARLRAAERTDSEPHPYTPPVLTRDGYFLERLSKNLSTPPKVNLYS